MRTLEEIKMDYWKKYDEYDKEILMHNQKLNKIRDELYILFNEFTENSRGLDNPGSLNDGYAQYLENRKKTLGW